MLSAPPSERYVFGEFILERSQQRVLRGDGTPLNLTPRLFSALLLFVERAGQLVEKDALMLALWPGLVVEENNLSQVVSGLRRALGDDTQGSRYIETVPRRGFRFIAPVTVLPDAPPVPNVVLADPPPPAAAPAPPGAGAADRGVAVDPGRGAGPVTRRSAGFAFVAAAAMGATAGAWWWFAGRAPSRGSGGMRSTLAVLPFKPLVAEARDELLEAIIECRCSASSGYSRSLNQRPVRPTKQPPNRLT